MCICVCRPGQIHWRDRAETIDAAAGMLLRRGISGREKEREREEGGIQLRAFVETDKSRKPRRKGSFHGHCVSI